MDVECVFVMSAELRSDLSAHLMFVPLQVVNMTHESEGTAVRRREVGCQWESPEEEWREVGCQSDSAERRDAAVQVDLLTQQLSWSRGAGETLCRYLTTHTECF